MGYLHSRISLATEIYRQPEDEDEEIYGIFRDRAIFRSLRVTRRKTNANAFRTDRRVHNTFVSPSRPDGGRGGQQIVSSIQIIPNKHRFIFIRRVLGTARANGQMIGGRRVRNTRANIVPIPHDEPPRGTCTFGQLQKTIINCPRIKQTARNVYTVVCVRGRRNFKH